MDENQLPRRGRFIVPTADSSANRGCQADETIPVLIVGAGPTGLAVANLLGMIGISTLIIESNPALSTIPKAIALDDEGLRICQAMGLGNAVSKCLLSGISVQCIAAGQLLATLIPTSQKNGYPLISTFYQPEFEAVLLEGLQRFPYINLRFQHTVEALEQSTDDVIVSIRTPTGTVRKVRCIYLLACDGGRSTVRHLLDIPMQGMTFAQKWLVIDSASNENSSPIVKIFCDPQRPAVSIPAPHNRRRWEFMLLPGETEKDMLEPAIISALLRQTDASPQTSIIRQTVYTFHAAHAKSFSQGRVFLLGDAVHMMPPFGGQGLNSGLRDAHNLAWKLALVLQMRASPQLLATYHQERSRHAVQMVTFASLLGTIFMSTARPLAFCRNLLIKMLSTLPLTRNYLTELRMKPQPKYTAGFFLFKRKRIIGSLLPQPEVITQQGRRVLLDEVLGPGFAVLRRHPDPEEAFAALKPEFWQRLGARFVCIQTNDEKLHHFRRGSAIQNVTCHPERVSRNNVVLSPSLRSRVNSAKDLPSEGEGSGSSFPLPTVVVRSTDKDFLCMSKDEFVVVRPDRFILGTFREENAAMFISAFQDLLNPHQG